MLLLSSNKRNERRIATASGSTSGEMPCSGEKLTAYGQTCEFFEERMFFFPIELMLKRGFQSEERR